MPLLPGAVMNLKVTAWENVLQCVFPLKKTLYSLFLSLCHAELFCMGFSFAAFFFFVLITRTTDLDYDSECFFFFSFPHFDHLQASEDYYCLTLLKLQCVELENVWIWCPLHFPHTVKALLIVLCLSHHSLFGRVGGDRRCGRGPPGDELVAFRFCHGLHRRGWSDAWIPRRLHCSLHSSR